MDFADKMLVKQQVNKLPSGGVEVVMVGNELRNPTAALERFHEIAAKRLGGQPYRYTYQVDRADVMETYYRTQKTERQVEAPARGGRTGGTPVYYPIHGGGQGRSQGGIGGGEAAVILASVVVLTLLIKAASKPKPASQEPPAQSETRTITVTDTKMVKDQRVAGQAMRLRGTATPVERLGWSQSRAVEVVVPSGKPVIGEMSGEDARRFAEAAVKSLESLGYNATVVTAPSAGAQVVKPVVLRAQGMMEAGQQQMTVEYELSSPATRGNPARVFVQTANPFAGQSFGDLSSVSLRYRPAALIKPLAKKLSALL